MLLNFPLHLPWQDPAETLFLKRLPAEVHLLHVRGPAHDDKIITADAALPPSPCRLPDILRGSLVFGWAWRQPVPSGGQCGVGVPPKGPAATSTASQRSRIPLVIGGNLSKLYNLNVFLKGRETCAGLCVYLCKPLPPVQKPPPQNGLLLCFVGGQGMQCVTPQSYYCVVRNNDSNKTNSAPYLPTSLFNRDNDSLTSHNNKVP